MIRALWILEVVLLVTGMGLLVHEVRSHLDSAPSSFLLLAATLAMTAALYLQHKERAARQ